MCPIKLFHLNSGTKEESCSEGCQHIPNIFSFFVKCTVHCSVTCVCQVSTFKAVLSTPILLRNLHGSFKHCLAHYFPKKVKPFTVRLESLANQSHGFGTERVMSGSLPAVTRGSVLAHVSVQNLQLSGKTACCFLCDNVSLLKFRLFSNGR